jgi:hypothetical protein
MFPRRNYLNIGVGVAIGIGVEIWGAKSRYRCRPRELKSNRDGIVPIQFGKTREIRVAGA